MSKAAEKVAGDQKRQQGRLRVAIDGQYRFTGDEDWLACTLIDISGSGMALSGKKSFYEGDKIEVRFTLEKRAIHIHLEITNLIGRKAGGRVTKIEDEDRLLIQEVINQQLLAGKTRME